jgi:hypothetical protein
MSKDNYPVAVYCIDPEYDIDHDYRLNFLKERGVTVDFIYNDFGQDLGFLHRTTRFLFLRSFAAGRRLNFTGRTEWVFLWRMFGQLAQRMGSWFYRLAKSKYYTGNWAHKVIEQSGAQVLCFDWIRPRKYVVDVLLGAAKEMSIPTVALPHGLFLYTNDLVTISCRANPKKKDNSRDIITMIMWLCKINYSKKSYRSRVLIEERFLCSEAPDIAMNG